MADADLKARKRIRQFLLPATLILVALPTAFGLVPMNGVYGFRLREAFASDADWYWVNEICSVWMIGACGVWLAAVYAWPRYGQIAGIAVALATFAAVLWLNGWKI